MLKKTDLIDTLIHQGQRKRLVSELTKKGIVDEKVLQAIGNVPRQWFFPTDFDQFIYRDAAFPIDHGQTISQPYTVAYQTELLGLKPNDKVLEIGTGSGYQAAILLAMGAKVYSVEYILPLLKKANKIFKAMGVEIQLFHGDGSLGLPLHAPFDSIVVTACAPAVPETYTKQLKIGGKLVIPVGDAEKVQTMMRITRVSETQTQTEVLQPCKFVPLKGSLGWK
ncbi:MAG: protein-L-isoaspartate(D-aspartate) O-methyltransferase [Flavobacteriaceae bacterium]|nr:protein-L-isoaspartate(D-aspartate) O-methyltransferase [Flavobacteriaceae bacterium]